MDSEDTQAGIRLAYNFIAREKARFREQGDAKLTSKYARLKAYFDRYMSEWEAASGREAS
jgi:hypothetical protein